MKVEVNLSCLILISLLILPSPFLKFATALVDLFIYWVSRDSSLTWINLHVYNDVKLVLFNGDFARENFAGTGIWTRDLLTHIFFIAAGTLLTGFLASSCVPDTVRPLLVAITLGELEAAAKATILIAIKQTLYIQ